MIQKLANLVESNRHSNKATWKIAVALKDMIWRFYYFPLDKLESNTYFLRRHFTKGKLPDFLIIGVQKGGTTSLWKHLKQHPKIEMCPKFLGTFGPGNNKNTKEVNFFDNEKNWSRGLKWYKSLFNDNGKIQGEATPNYISNVSIHQRMFSIIPDAKFILILRNPVTRLWSAYNHMMQESKTWGGFEYDQSFEYNLHKEINSGFKEERGVIRKGFYIDQIESLLKYFKREQLLILISEHMRDNPQEIYDKIFDFLGIDRYKINYNPRVHKREYKECMSEENKAMLYKLYEPYNERLFRFLGYTIPEWELH